MWPRATFDRIYRQKNPIDQERYSGHKTNFQNQFCKIRYDFICRSNRNVHLFSRWIRKFKNKFGRIDKEESSQICSASGQIKFKTAVKDVQQLETFGARYRSNDWAIDPALNATQVFNYVENHYIGYKYPEKTYYFGRDGREGGDKFGVFLVHTNVDGLPEMDYHEFLQHTIQDSETEYRIEENYLYLSDIIDYFNIAGINKIYIMDATCSVIAEEHQFAAENILRILKRRLIRTRKQLKKKERTRRISENPFSSPGASPASATTLSPTSPTEDTLSVVEVSPL